MPVTLDIGAALRAARQVDGLARGIPRMQQRAIGTLRRRLQPEAARAVPARFNVAPRDVRARVNVTLEGRDTVALIGSGVPLPAHLFGGEYGGRLSPGASWQVLASGPRKIRPGTFVRKRDRKGKIMTRAADAFGQRVQRLPIKTVYGPSVGAMLLSDTVGQKLGEFGARIMDDEVARLIAVELAGL
jgi:hypothetical protein